LSGGEKLLYRRAEENKIFNDFDSLQEKMRNENRRYKKTITFFNNFEF
jgi:hypothetical protein